MKLFVGNLSYDASEEEVRALFEPFEPIMEFHRPVDRETGQPRGFAFITLANDEVGAEAVAALDGKSFSGRNLRCNEAEDRRNKPPQRRYNQDDDITEGNTKRVDDRPVGKDGEKVRYKSI